jgi:hypothetical protein
MQDLSQEIYQYLNTLKEKRKEYRQLIINGLNLLKEKELI